MQRNLRWIIGQDEFETSPQQAEMIYLHLPYSVLDYPAIPVSERRSEPPQNIPVSIRRDNTVTLHLFMASIASLITALGQRRSPRQYRSKAPNNGRALSNPPIRNLRTECSLMTGVQNISHKVPMGVRHFALETGFSSAGNLLYSITSRRNLNQVRSAEGAADRKICGSRG